MHKIFLTESEASVISGAKEIINELGGFPSMENGELCSVSIKKSDCEKIRYDISLIFDIENWRRVGSSYKEIPTSPHRFIELRFSGARSIQVESFAMKNCGEIKFGNDLGKEKMRQDALPTRPIIVERPFCTFYARSGNDLLIMFDENECQISAIVRESL